jgi:hypothetical protein
MARYTFKGYDFQKAVYDERNFIKTTVAAAVAAQTAGVEWYVCWPAAVAAIGGKLALNALHYWSNE